MPSGAYVRAELYRYGLNIYLHGLAEDQQRSSGLCGNFDENPMDGLKIKDTEDMDPEHWKQEPVPRTFSDSYRLVRNIPS